MESGSGADRGALQVPVQGNRSRDHRDRRSRCHRALFRPRGLWSRRRNTCARLLRGKCLGATRFARKSNTFLPQTQHQKPCQGIARQWVSDPGCTPGTEVAHGLPCGSDPPKKRPSRAQTGLSERSLPRFFLAGRPLGRAGHDGRPKTSEPQGSAPKAFARCRADHSFGHWQFPFRRDVLEAGPRASRPIGPAQAASDADAGLGGLSF